LCVSRISVALNWLNLNLSLAGLSWPLYIGGQVSRIQSGSIQITMSVYDVILYFDYIYAWAYLTGPRGTKIMGLNSYTLATMPIGPTCKWVSLFTPFPLSPYFPNLSDDSSTHCPIADPHQPSSPSVCVCQVAGILGIGRTHRARQNEIDLVKMSSTAGELWTRPGTTAIDK
jgi:hypothetical protein